MLIGVYGDERGPGEHARLVRRACLLPPPKRARRRAARRRSTAKKLGIPVIPIHRAVLTQAAGSRTHPREASSRQSEGADASSPSDAQRAACFWATPCGRGCSIRANYQSTTVHLPPALATGNLDIIPTRWRARSTLDKDGKATGVHLHRQDAPARRRTCEGARRGARRQRVRDGAHPAQLEVARVSATARELQRQGRQVHHGHRRRRARRPDPGAREPAAAQRGRRGRRCTSTSPWWLYKEQLAGKLDFARGYHIEFGGGRHMPGIGVDGRPRAT